MSHEPIAASLAQVVIVVRPHRFSVGSSCRIIVGQDLLDDCYARGDVVHLESLCCDGCRDCVAEVAHRFQVEAVGYVPCAVLR